MVLRTVIVVGALVALFHVASCSQSDHPAQPAAISALVRTPASFDGKVVTVTGRVAERLGVMGAGGYRLVDADGSSLIVLGLATPPKIGEMTTVTGSFRMAYVLGQHDGAVMLAR